MTEKTNNFEEILKPGNLVHGIGYLEKSDFKGLIQKGICCAEDVGKEGLFPNTISFALLQKGRNAYFRYLSACHSGPRSDDEISMEISLVVDGNDLKNYYGERVYAVGQAFRGKKNIENFPVLEIGYWDWFEDVWEDEVRVYKYTDLPKYRGACVSDKYLSSKSVILPGYPFNKILAIIVNTHKVNELTDWANAETQNLIRPTIISISKLKEY
jgi:hypothetical protein